VGGFVCGSEDASFSRRASSRMWPHDTCFFARAEGACGCGVGAKSRAAVRRRVCARLGRYLSAYTTEQTVAMPDIDLITHDTDVCDPAAHHGGVEAEAQQRTRNAINRTSCVSWSQRVVLHLIAIPPRLADKWMGGR
jgi:hypothetical protein